MANLAQGRECFGSRCGEEIGLAVGVHSDEQLSESDSARNTQRKSPAGGREPGSPGHRTVKVRPQLSVNHESEWSFTTLARSAPIRRKLWASTYQSTTAFTLSPSNG